MYKISDEELIRELEKRFKDNKSSINQLQKLTHQLQELNKRLEDSEALKTHFISNITNEIINPFAAILGLSKNILDAKKENWDKVISMVRLIHSEAFHLDFQLKNIFAAAKLEAGEWVPEIMKVDVFQVIQGVIDLFVYEAKKKNLDIEIKKDEKSIPEETFIFNTDPEKLRIIISNLLSNAINFSQSDNKVIIEIGLENEMMRLSVIDFGQGVSDINKKIIYDRFKRLDSGINSVNRGHGLGLSVNKAILDLLNGSIDLESEPHKKTTFTITLPKGELDADSNESASEANEFIFDDGDSEMF